jgi:3-phenylpropionate/trans-cinnamate dioxygenase ferredoxin subunit
MLQKKYKWYKIAETVSELQFGENRIIQIEVAGKKICMVKKTNGLAACTARCPHAGGNMAEGYLNKSENIICPVHHYIFNLENGREITGEGYFLKIFPVKVNEVGIFLGIEDSGLFNWLK